MHRLDSAALSARAPSEHADGLPTGRRRWLFSTHKKDIGTRCLLFSLAMFLLGGVLALTCRAELLQAGVQPLDPGLFKRLTTMHGPPRLDRSRARVAP